MTVNQTEQLILKASSSLSPSNLVQARLCSASVCFEFLMGTGARAVLSILSGEPEEQEGTDLPLAYKPGTARDNWFPDSL